MKEEIDLLPIILLIGRCITYMQNPLSHTDFTRLTFLNEAKDMKTKLAQIYEDETDLSSLMPEALAKIKELMADNTNKGD